MATRTVSKLVGLGIVIAVLAAVPAPVVYARVGVAQLLWHDDEAFLFIADSRIGWKMSSLLLLLSTLSTFGLAPQDVAPSVSVVRITPGAVESHRVNMASADLLVVDGYVSTGAARWNGTRFEPAKPREPLGPRGVPAEFTNTNGWSKRFLYPQIDRSQAVDFTLGGQRAAWCCLPAARSRTWISNSPTRPAEESWSVDTGAEFMMVRNYDAVFKR